MAVPKPTPQRLVFRPARRVPWGTWIIALLFLMVTAGATGAFLLVVQPGRVADLARNESLELGLARSGAATVLHSVSTLAADLGSSDPFSLPADRVASDLAAAQAIQKQANDAITHAETARAYLTEADGMPFQLHSPLFVTVDRPVVTHLENGLQAAERLAHAGAFQLELAQTVATDQQTWSGQFAPALSSGAWAAAARSATTLVTMIKGEQLGAANPDALIDPLWGKWLDARLQYLQTAQEYALNAAAGQTVTAQQLHQTLITQSTQIVSAQAAAKQDVAAWMQKSVQPVLDTASREFSAAGA